MEVESLVAVVGNVGQSIPGSNVEQVLLLVQVAGLWSAVALLGIAGRSIPGSSAELA